MPITILNRSFTNSVTGETTGHYKANAGDVITCSYTISEIIQVECSGFQYIFDYVNWKVTSSFFNFRNEGFLAGDFVRCIHYDASGSILTNTISSVVEVTTSYIKLGNAIPIIASGETFVIKQSGSLPLRQEMHLFINHKSSVSTQLDQFSHIDNEATVFQCLGLPTITNASPGSFTQFGNRSGQWEVVPSVMSKGDGAPDLQYVLSFTVVQSGIYQPTLFDTSSDLNLAIGFRLFRVANDLNTATTLFDDYLSNTGWFNEGYNDEPNFLTLTQGIPNLFYNLPSTYTFKVSGATAAGLKGLGASYIPTDASYYKNKPQSQTKLGMTIPTTLAVLGDTLLGENDSNILDPKYTIDIDAISIVSGVVSCTITFSPYFSTFFDGKVGNRRFLIWAKIDNVNIIVFDGQLGFKPVPNAPFVPEFLEVIDISTNSIVPSSNTIMPLTIEDNASILSKIQMAEDDLLSSINVKILTVNTVTGDEYILQSDSYNLTSSPYLGGAYIAPQSIVKNYNLASGSEKNVSTLTPTILTAGVYYFLLNYPFLVRWENWLEQNPYPLDFYGINTKNWLTYQTTDWKLFIEVSKTYPDFHLEYAREQLILSDYDSDSNVTTHDIVLKRLDGTVLTSVIDEQLTVTVNTTATGALNDEIIELTIEPFQSAQRWQVSTSYNNLSPSNPLQLISSITTGTSNVSIFSLDTNKIDISGGVSISAEIKGLAITTPISNRIKDNFTYVKLPITQEENEFSTIECCDPELKLATLSNSDSDKNDVAGVYVFAGSSTEDINSKVYKNGVLISNDIMSIMPDDENSRMIVYQCKDWLMSDGAGCYTVVVSGLIAGIPFEYLYGKYQLFPYNSVTARNQFKLRCFNNKYSSDENINFANSLYYDDIRLKGRFGQMQPKTVVDNLVYNDRTTRTVINENLPEYILDSNKIKPRMINKLVKMLLQATTIEASDFNAYSPDIIRNLPVILPQDGQGILLEYMGGTRDRIITCTFRKKVLNERTYTK